MWFCRCTSRRRQTPEKGPWLTRAQKDLLSKLEDVNLLEMCSKRAGDILRSSTTDGLTSLCCLFISACRVLGDVKKVHMFACDLLTLQGYCRFVTAMASMWPLPLRRANNEYIPIIRVLQHFFFVKLVEESKEEQQKMKVCLEWLCAWSCGPQAVNEVAENILSDVKDVLSTSIFINQELSWNAELAFDLLCHLEEWQWASGFVISKLLCPIIRNWAEKPDEAKEQFIQSVVHVLGRVMSHCPVTCPSSADQVVNSLLTLLKESAEICVKYTSLHDKALHGSSCYGTLPLGQRSIAVVLASFCSECFHVTITVIKDEEQNLSPTQKPKEPSTSVYTGLVIHFIREL